MEMIVELTEWRRLGWRNLTKVDGKSLKPWSYFKGLWNVVREAI